MSKPKLVVSFAFALVPLVATGWWAAKTLWLMAPPAYATQNDRMQGSAPNSGRDRCYCPPPWRGKPRPWPPGRDDKPVRVFATFTEDLERLTDWLEQCGVTTVA